MRKSDLSVVFRAVSIIAVIAAFYWQDLAAVFTSAWVDSEVSYLLAVPILVLYLVYRKRKVLDAAIRNQSEERELSKNKLPLISGVLLCAMAVFLYFYGSITFTPLEYHMLTLPVFAAGLILIVFNYSALRQLVFPLCFLFFMTPPPAAIFYSAGSFLADVSAHASAAIVNAFGMPSTVAYYAGSPNVIMTNGGTTIATFVVDFTCSGINGLITFVVFTLFLAYLVRDKFWKKVAVVAVGLPLIYFLNILRISTLLAVGFHYGTATVELLFHSFSGLILTFIGALLLVLVAQKALKANFYGSNPSSCEKCSASKSSGQNFCESCGKLLRKAEAKITGADLKKIAAVAVIVAMLMLVQAPIYALARTQTNLLEQVRRGQDPSTNILPQIDGYTLNFTFRDTQFEVEYHQDATLTYGYTDRKSVV
jgi:exosortase